MIERAEPPNTDYETTSEHATALELSLCTSKRSKGSTKRLTLFIPYERLSPRAQQILSELQVENRAALGRSTRHGFEQYAVPAVPRTLVEVEILLSRYRRWSLSALPAGHKRWISAGWLAAYTLGLVGTYSLLGTPSL